MEVGVVEPSQASTAAAEAELNLPDANEQVEVKASADSHFAPLVKRRLARAQVGSRRKHSRDR